MMTRRPARCGRYQTWLVLPLAVSYVSLLVSRPPFLFFFFFSYKSPPVRGTLPLLPLSFWLLLTFLLPISALSLSLRESRVRLLLLCSVLSSARQLHLASALLPEVERSLLWPSEGGVRVLHLLASLLSFSGQDLIFYP